MGVAAVEEAKDEGDDERQNGRDQCETNREGGQERKEHHNSESGGNVGVYREGDRPIAVRPSTLGDRGCSVFDSVFGHKSLQRNR
jgi:hypothetical protein